MYQTHQLPQRGYEMGKSGFIYFLKSNNVVSATFKYVDCGNDEWNSNGTMRRSATYEFYLDYLNSNGDKFRKLLVYKTHRRSHSIVEEEITKKYSNWLNFYLLSLSYENQGQE